MEEFWIKVGPFEVRVRKVVPWVAFSLIVALATVGAVSGFPAS